MIRFDEALSVGEDLLFNVNLLLHAKSIGLRCEIDGETGYHHGNNPNSLTRKAVTSSRVFDTGFSWYLAFREIDNSGLFSDEALFSAWARILATEFLEVYGFDSNGWNSYKRSSFLEMKQYISRRKIMWRFKPVGISEKAKRLIYLFFRPLYRPIRRLQKAAKLS